MAGMTVLVQGPCRQGKQLSRGCTGALSLHSQLVVLDLREKTLLWVSAAVNTQL